MAEQIVVGVQAAIDSGQLNRGDIRLAIFTTKPQCSNPNNLSVHPGCSPGLADGATFCTLARIFTGLRPLDQSIDSFEPLPSETLQIAQACGECPIFASTLVHLTNLILFRAERQLEIEQQRTLLHPSGRS